MLLLMLLLILRRDWNMNIYPLGWCRCCCWCCWHPSSGLRRDELGVGRTCTSARGR